MNPSRPSITAAVVACARAAADPDDSLTPVLLPRAYRRILDLSSSRRLGASLSALVRRLGSGGLLDHMRLRTAAIDALILRAVQGGAARVVLLGAGLDVRAHRLEVLAEVPVFELDHPASQAYKCRRIAGAPARGAAVRYVAVDFERELFADRLVAAGFEPGAPSFWVWEGVSMYLPRAATAATIRGIAAVAAPGSRIALTYMLPTPLGRASKWIHRGLALLDEPLRGGLRPDEVRGMLRRAGFAVLSDGSNWDWARELGQPGAAWALLWRAERLVVAERVGTTPSG